MKTRGSTCNHCIINSMEKSQLCRNSSSSSSSVKRVKKEGDGGLARPFLPRGGSKRETNCPSPSAWALSPGRSLLIPSPPEEKKIPNKGTAGVLKFLIRQKKVVSPEYHQYRVAYSRLLQWRFANARAEASMAALNRVAQDRVLRRWVRISIMRKLCVEKGCEIKRLENETKVYQVLKGEMGLLNEWRNIEAKNMEAVGRVLRKLSAISLSLPLLHNAQADVISVYEAISTADRLMDNIKFIIRDMHSQVEKKCFLLTEFLVILKQHNQFLPQLQNLVTLLASLQAEEKSLRVHHIQVVKLETGIY